MTQAVTTAQQSTSVHAVSPDLTETKRCEHQLLMSAAWSAVEDNSNSRYLLSSNTLAVVDRELSRAVQPVGPGKFAGRAAVILVGSYPMRGPDMPEIYLGALSGAMAGYPADVIRDAITAVVRKSRFLPSVAEFCSAADALMAPRRLLRAGVAKQLMAHRQREANERERQRQEAEGRAQRERLYARVVERFGDAAPPAGSYDRARDTIGRVHRSTLPWLLAVNALEPWAITAWRLAAILAEAVDLKEVGKLGFLQVLAIARHLGDGDEAAASALLAKAKAGEIEADATPPDAVTEGPDPISRGPGWNDVWSSVWHAFGPDAATERVPA